ncbi:hypothetical protein RJT34_03671 [Clitoria ternatea]|uniref:Cytochrome P450 n=1 Tax=Clitoria ternatea TaxID=43366 RepID=A0AAN9Q1Y7_CLITE
MVNVPKLSFLHWFFPIRALSTLLFLFLVHCRVVWSSNHNMFVGGTGAPTTVTVWTMSKLMKNPKVMEKGTK